MNPARAQTPQQATPPEAQEPHAITPESTGLGTAVTPLPDEEVMRPTDDGLTFTPSLARAFALGWINQNLGDQANLSSDQVKRFSDKIADRAMRMARDDPNVTRDSMEALFESLLIRGPRDKLSPELARKTAQRMRPVISRWHEFLDGVAQDADGVLAPEQLEEVRKAVQRRHRRLDGMDEMMERWSRGEMQESDRLDRLLEPGISDEEIEVPQGAPQHPGYRRARRRAQWQARNVGPTEWLRFLTATRTSLHFDPQQAARADQIYAGYKAQAEAIMTPAWREALRENRARSELRWELKGLPTGPWLFRLEQEYRGMIAPLEALRDKFYQEVLAVATDAQREAFITELRARFAEHGLVMQDADRAVILELLR